MASVIPEPRKPDPDLCTVAEFAEQYRVPPEEVRRWVKFGYISYVLDGPRKMRRIRKSEVLIPIIPDTLPPDPVDPIDPVVNLDIEVGTDADLESAADFSNLKPKESVSVKSVPSPARAQGGNGRSANRR